MRLLWIVALGVAGCGSDVVLGTQQTAEAPAAGGSTSTGTGGGSPCGDPEALVFGDLDAVDDDGDGLFEPGERVHVGRWVENTGSTERAARIRVTADDARVVPDGSGDVTLSVAPGARVELRSTFAVPVEVWGGSEVGFTLADYVAPTDCVPPRAGEIVVTVSTYGDDLDTCPMTRQLALTEPTLVDAGGDGTLEPGEDGSIQVRLSNPGPLDHDWYPGVELIAHDARVRSVTSDGWRYAMFAGTADVLQAGFHVDASVPRGTELRFTLRPGALHVRCRNLTSLEYSFVVQ